MPAITMTAPNTISPPPFLISVRWIRLIDRGEGTDWDNSRQYHIDLSTGSTTVYGGDTQIECENSLPGGQQTIIRNPSEDLETDTTPSCNRKTYPVGSTSGFCSVGTGGNNESPSSQTTGSRATITDVPTLQNNGEANLQNEVPTTLTTTTRIPPGAERCGWPGFYLGKSSR